MDNTSKASYQPIEVQFRSEGLKCTASHYLPTGEGPFPIIVMAHGLGGTRHMRLPAYAERFVEAGYSCLIFDYRHFGDSEGHPRQLLDIDKQINDWRSAVAYARTLDNIDLNKVIIWGTSFGGGHVITTAANDATIAAVISQCPFTDGIASAFTLPPLISMRLTAIALKDRIGSWLGASPKMVATAGRPDEVALMNAPDALDGYLALAAKDEPIKNYVAARFGLDIIHHFPGRLASKVIAPILFCICDNDSVAPAKASLRHIKHAPNGEIRRYPYGHFEIYQKQPFEQVVADQISFLKRHVPVN